VLFATFIFFLFMRQNQMLQQLDSKIETLKTSISATKSNAKTAENAESMKLAKEPSDSNAKLMNAEFGKFERELRDSNNKWLWGWTGFVITIILFVLTTIGVALWFSVKSIIADRVENYIAEFKEDVGQLDMVKNQLKILEYQYTNKSLKDIPESYFRNESAEQFEQIKELREEALLYVLDNKESLLGTKYRAATVLAARNSPILVTPVLEYLNSIVDSDSDLSNDFTLNADPRYYLCQMVEFVGQIHTQDAYNGLKKFLNLLLTKKPKHKDLLLGWTAYSLASISVVMNRKDSIPVLRKSIPDLEFVSQEWDESLEHLARYFNIFNEPAGIKEILEYHSSDISSALQETCFELLQNHYPEFVEKYRAENENTNTANEDIS